jgi:hypothetical protein
MCVCELGVVVHACSPSTQRLRLKDYEFEFSLGYIVRPPSQNKQTNKKPCMWMCRTVCVYLCVRWCARSFLVPRTVLYTYCFFSLFLFCFVFLAVLRFHLRTLHLSHASGPLSFNSFFLFFNVGSHIFVQGWPGPSSSYLTTSWVAQTSGMNHHLLLEMGSC